MILTQNLTFVIFETHIIILKSTIRKLAERSEQMSPKGEKKYSATLVI